jgi:hypothetical protein
VNWKIQVVVIDEDGSQETREIHSIERKDLKPETLGLTLAEGKAILKDIQQIVVQQQVSSGLAPCRQCPDCGKSRRGKGYHDLSLRTVFGHLRVKSPRLHHCGCGSHKTSTFSPLAELLPDHTTPELLFLETKWASLMSYGMTAKLLEDVLPMDDPLNAFTIRRHVCDVAERLERELGKEQDCFIEGCQRDWAKLPAPDGPLTVGIDGGYVRGHRKQGQFEVIAGKSILAFKREREEKPELSGRCFAFVQTYDEKPKRRLFELLQAHGLQPNQQVAFLSDGGEDVRSVQLYLHPDAEHLLDWFHVTMRLTVLKQIAKGLPEKVGEGEDEYELRSRVLKDLESLKWYLWHGNVFQAVKKLQGLEMDLDGAAFETRDEAARKLLKGAEELHTYVERNQEFIPNYGGALPKRGKNRFRLCRVSSQSSDKQANGEAAANGMEPAGSPSPAPNPDARAGRGMGNHLSRLVSRISAEDPSGGQDRCLTPGISRSRNPGDLPEADFAGH